MNYSELIKIGYYVINACALRSMAAVLQRAGVSDNTSGR
jgi:hypothetical protein